MGGEGGGWTNCCQLSGSGGLATRILTPSRTAMINHEEKAKVVASVWGGRIH